MSEGRVQPCPSWSAFQMMSLMTCPLPCERYTAVTGRLCRQPRATSLGQILIVLNRRDATARERFHPFEIADLSKANLSGWYSPKKAPTWRLRLRARVLEKVIYG